MCGACGLRIPPAGSFGPQLGAGSLSTDTRLGGLPAGAAGALGSWSSHPITWLVILVFAYLLFRPVFK